MEIADVVQQAIEICHDADGSAFRVSFDTNQCRLRHRSGTVQTAADSTKKDSRAQTLDAPPLFPASLRMP